MIEIVDKIEKHQYLAYSYIRIFLGLALASRGLVLILNPELISQLVSDEKLYIGYAYVAIIHLFCGLMLALGFFTRIVSILQIPALLGAVFVVHKGEGLMTAGQSLELSVMVLFLLVIFLIFGSGPLSLSDRIFKKRGTS